MDNLQNIIDFAIAKEQEAVDFYDSLAVKVKSKAISEELLKIKAMEEQHRDRLQALEVGELMQTLAPQVTDLKIADYIVEAEPGEDMNWQDLLTIAMHREMAAMQLYSTLARKVTDAATIQLFERLASEEASHKAMFEKIWDEDIMKEN